MIVFPTRHALYIACVGFGLGVGNMISLPALIVQQEFHKEHFAKIISMIVAFNQFTFAFGPGVLGLIRDVTGSYTASLLLCILLQGLAAGIVLFRHHAIDGSNPTAGPGFLGRLRERLTSHKTQAKSHHAGNL
jgi:cyanate permease